MLLNKLQFAPRIIAHRGASALAPENTAAAFKKAKELGAQWVELDVTFSADGQLVVFHDEELARTSNGKGIIYEQPYAYLKTLDTGSWFNSTFAHEHILTLAEVLALLQTLKLSVNIEIKDVPGREEALAEAVVKVIAQQSFTQDWFISSFSTEILRNVRQLMPECTLGLLMHEWDAAWPTLAAELATEVVSCYHPCLNVLRIGQVKAAGYKLLTYTVNDPDLAQYFYSLGVTAVFSDCPLPMHLLLC